MTEGLFILTTIFVAYVVYVIINEPKATTNSAEPDAPAANPVARPVVQAAEKPEAVTSKPAAVKESKPAAPAKPASPAKAAPKVEAKAAPKAAPKAAAKPAAKPKAPAKASVAPAPTPAPASSSAAKAGLKDPVSGEIATSYSNYRFTKRWIKDALVAEGLLPKVYKNTELDPAIEAQIKDAVLKLESMDKYKA